VTQVAGTDVFISYKREDRPRVVALVEGLRASGLRVWWDADIPGGEPWRPAILEQLEHAKCAIVVWSELSVGPAGEFVHEEASRAKARGMLLPVRIDRVVPPLGFGETQSLDLIDWSGRRDTRFNDVLNSARAIVEGRPRPTPTAPRRPSHWTIGAVVAATAAAVGFAANVASLQNAVCRIAGVRALCARLEWGGVPGRLEEAAWIARSPGDCAALRTFIERFPRGVYAEQATRLLQASRKDTAEAWVEETRKVPLFIGKGLRVWPTEEAARADALERGKRDARLACGGFDSGVFRLRDAAVDSSAPEWNCDRSGGGTRCGFEGYAVCQVDAKHTTEREVCQ